MLLLWPNWLSSCCSVPVLDRVGLIIEIFAQRARSREARLQVGHRCSVVQPFAHKLNANQAEPALAASEMFCLQYFNWLGVCCTGGARSA
jgi:hypothetical protein